MAVELARIRHLHRPLGFGDAAGLSVECIVGGRDRAMDGEEESGTPPTPIDGGRVAQAIVEYTGTRRGAVTYRPPSGREYRFDASPRNSRRYVLDEDIDYFGRSPHFRVLEDGRIDPEAERWQRLEAELADVRTQLEEQHEDEKERRSSQRRRPGGRPEVPIPEVERLWHLRHHCDPSWSIKELAARFIESDYFDPEGAVSARLYRFKKRYPHLTRPDRCSLCLEGCYPSSPS